MAAQVSVEDDPAGHGMTPPAVLTAGAAARGTEAAPAVDRALVVHPETAHMSSPAAKIAPRRRCSPRRSTEA
jgi:hypothetical protein